MRLADAFVCNKRNDESVFLRIKQFMEFVMFSMFSQFSFDILFLPLFLVLFFFFFLLATSILEGASTSLAFVFGNEMLIESLEKFKDNNLIMYAPFVSPIFIYLLEIFVVSFANFT